MSNDRTTNSAATGTPIQLVPEADLRDPRRMGGRLRAYCHLHGSARQRSLSIALDGEHAGFGYCHQCGAKVLVPELNPDAAARLSRAPTSSSQMRSAPSLADLLRRPRAAAAAARSAKARRLDISAASSAATSAASSWQRSELEQLVHWYPQMRKRLLSDERARAYLAARSIPLDIAEAAGVGYIPADARLSLNGGMAKWRDRLVFPLSSPSPAGLRRGFIGRSLYGWQQGMDENAHKALLDARERPAEEVRAWGHRWEKTNPAGWFGYEHLLLQSPYSAVQPAVIVEGALDALALCAAGLPLTQLIALAGTAAHAEWIPAQVQAVVLALDGDERGQQAAATLRRALREDAGILVAICMPPAAEDQLGKDWCERWRRAAWDGVAPVFDAVDVLALSAAERSALSAGLSCAALPPQMPAALALSAAEAASATGTETETEDEAAEAEAEIQAAVVRSDERDSDDAAVAVQPRPWLQDVIVQTLQARGMVLAEARLLEPVPSAVSLEWEGGARYEQR